MGVYSYPFTAIVGQDAMKKALLLNIINPMIGGVLINGEKGTAKSTMVRAVANLAKRNFCELPLSISEDMLVGSIDIEKTIENGKVCFQKGILGKADNGVIYIDEVNLLPDHIVDILLNVSSDHINRIEREGLSVEESSDFILIGTMNSEEGFLRPQFIDRFGLFVQVESENDAKNRVEILKRIMDFDNNSQSFSASYETDEKKLSDFIKNAKETLNQVILTDENIQSIINICLEANVDGHRGDIVMTETVKALAAFNLRTYVTEDDIKEAAFFALMHRRKMPNEEQKEKQEHNDDSHEHEHEEEQENQPEQEENEEQQENPDTDENKVEQNSEQNLEDQGENDHEKEDPRPQKPKSSNSKMQTFNIGENFKVKDFGFKPDRKARSGQGKRTTIRSAAKSGQYLFSTEQRINNDLALDATIRAAAPYQRSRNKNGLSIAIKDEDIREKVRQKKISNLLVFVVDGSGSMGADSRMIETKGAILSLLKDAYVKRDRVASVVFRGNDAEVMLPPTRSVERGYKMLETMPTGGKTPLNAGIVKAMQVIKSEQTKNKNILPMMIVITDGKGNVPLKDGENPRKELMDMAQKISGNKSMQSMIIDIEKQSLMSFGIAKDLANSLNASYFKIDDLKSEGILELVERVRS